MLFFCPKHNLTSQGVKIIDEYKDIAEIRKQFKLDDDLLKIVVEDENTPTLDTKENERV